MYLNFVTNWREGLAVADFVSFNIISFERYFSELVHQNIPVLKIIFYSEILSTEQYSQI